MLDMQQLFSKMEQGTVLRLADTGASSPPMFGYGAAPYLSLTFVLKPKAKIGAQTLLAPTLPREGQAVSSERCCQNNQVR